MDTERSNYLEKTAAATFYNASFKPQSSINAKNEQISCNFSMISNSASFQNQVNENHSKFCNVTTGENYLIQECSINNPTDSTSIPFQQTEPGSSESKFPQAFRLNETNVCPEAIRTITNDSLDGQRILKTYENEKVLKPNDRDILVDIIINRCGPKVPRGGVNSFFLKVAEAINQLMENELVIFYYVAPFSALNPTKNAKGKLPDKWRNICHKMNKVQGKKKACNEEDIESRVKIKEEVEVLGEHDLASKIEFLKNFKDKTWEQLKDHWDQTYCYRKEIFLYNSFEKILIEWPILNSKLGPQLIEYDFHKSFPFSSSALYEKWELFFDTVYELKGKGTRDPKGQALCVKYNTLRGRQHEEGLDLDVLRLHILPYMITMNGVRKTGTGIIKFSTEDSSNGFVIWSKDINEGSKLLDERAKRYINLGFNVQPVLLVIGKEIEKPLTCYVCLNDRIWEIQKPIDALNITFKFMTLMNAAYPRDCEHIWYVIQKCIYNISTNQQRHIPAAAQMITAIELKKLKMSQVPR